MKGRLKHSNLDYNAKHPILLTAKHPVVQLLLEKPHRDSLHEGREYVRHFLQHELGIVGLQNALRKFKSRCIQCRHRSANQIRPPMADLPRERLDEHVFPYTHTGVVYTGLTEVNATTYLEKMVLPLLLSNNESRAHRSRTVVGHRVLSSCRDKIHCRTWLPKYRNHWQRKKIRLSSRRAEDIHEWVGQS